MRPGPLAHTASVPLDTATLDRAHRLRGRRAKPPPLASLLREAIEAGLAVLEAAEPKTTAAQPHP